MGKRMVVCQDCGQEKPYRARGRCNSCYIRFYDKHLRKTPKTRGPGRTCICVECKSEAIHAGKGLCSRCYNRAYRERPGVRERHAEVERQRRARNPEHVRKLDRRRNQTEKRKRWKRQYQRQYYLEHQDELREYQRQYRRADTTRQTIYKKRRRSRVNGLPTTLLPEDWAFLLALHNHACFYCGATDAVLEAEHKLPASRGDGYTPENIVPSCGPCNRRKKDMTVREYFEYLTELGEEPTFDPGA